jgi:hypothetical protein
MNLFMQLNNVFMQGASHLVKMVMRGNQIQLAGDIGNDLNVKVMLPVVGKEIAWSAKKFLEELQRVE